MDTRTAGHELTSTHLPSLTKALPRSFSCAAISCDRFGEGQQRPLQKARLTVRGGDCAMIHTTYRIHICLGFLVFEEFFGILQLLLHLLRPVPQGVMPAFSPDMPSPSLVIEPKILRRQARCMTEMLYLTLQQLRKVPR